MKRVEHREGDVSFSLEQPGLLDKVPLGWVWLGLAAGGWGLVGLIGWAVVSVVGCIRG